MRETGVKWDEGRDCVISEQEAGDAESQERRVGFILNGVRGHWRFLFVLFP